MHTAPKYPLKTSTVALWALAWLALAGPAGAFSETLTADGTALRLPDSNPWKNDPYLPLAGYTPNVAGVYPEELRDAAIRSLQRWQRATGDVLQFDYWQGNDPEVFVPALRRDGISSLFFSSADEDGHELGLRTAGYTKLWYDADTGAIVEVDIVLNDIDFLFTTDPVEVTYDQEGWFGHVLRLEDVIAHELGHAIGLGHSGTRAATMYPSTWYGQGELGCDDLAGSRTLYGGPGVGCCPAVSWIPGGSPCWARG